MTDLVKPKTVIIVFISFITLLTIYNTVSRANELKKEYNMKINFLVSKRIESPNGFCELKDKKGKRMPIESHFWHKDEVYTGDSIVKLSNSTLVSIYRKKDWNDEKYYIAKQFNLE